MSGTTSLPIVMTSDGPIARSPAELNTALLDLATSLAPGITTNLPGTLIEDIASTDTGALIVIEQAIVDLINSITPRGANAFLLNQLGQIYGVPIGGASNTSVLVVFSASGAPGYVIPPGFIVSDGSVQYRVATGGAIGSSGSTTPLLAIATQTGSFAVPAGTVTKLITSVPATIVLTVTNPLAGSPGLDVETEASYRSRVLNAGLVTSQGTQKMLKAALSNVSGVQARLVSVRQQTGGWEIIVGGSGDPYAIGFAIYQSMFDISSIVGSIIRITNITNTNPAVVTTDLNHGYSTGQSVVISGAQGLISTINGTWQATVTSPNQFSIQFNGVGAGTYTGGGVISPNFRNQTVNIFDYPDTYTIPYVIPPSQTVSMVITWNTSFSNFISPSTVASLVQPNISDYINNLGVGQAINLFELQATFQSAVSSLIDPTLVTRMVFNVSINGIGVAPASGTGIISGDPESYFTTTPSAIVINQG